jgi:hypothetical protein
MALRLGSITAHLFKAWLTFCTASASTTMWPIENTIRSEAPDTATAAAPPRSALSETEIADYLSTISASGIDTDEARDDADFVPYHCADFPEADEAAIRRFLGLVNTAVRMVEEQRQRADTRAKLTVIEGGRHATPRS